MKYNGAISIDPAGIGSSGIVIYNLSGARPTFLKKITIKSKTTDEAIENHLKKLNDIKKAFGTKFNSNKLILIIEDFHIFRKITEPTSTPKLIGAVIAWCKINGVSIELEEPNLKNKIKYNGQIPFNGHELDAHKHMIHWYNTKGKR